MPQVTTLLKREERRGGGERRLCTGGQPVTSGRERQGRATVAREIRLELIVPFGRSKEKNECQNVDLTGGNRFSPALLMDFE